MALLLKVGLKERLAYSGVEDDLLPDHALREWSIKYMDSLNDIKDLRAPLRLPDLMRSAGFVDLEHRMIPLHTCAWSNGTQD